MAKAYITIGSVEDLPSSQFRVHFRVEPDNAAGYDDSHDFDFGYEPEGIVSTIRSIVRTDLELTDLDLLVKGSFQSRLLPGIGNDIARASTIEVTHDFHRITGIGAIQNINVHSSISLEPGATLRLQCPGAVTTIVGGNIALGSTDLANRILVLIWGDDNKWHPPAF